MQFDPEIKKIEDEFIDYIINSPLFMGEKLIFSTIKAYFMTRENLTQEELKELTGFSSGAISQELQKLVERGLIEISNISSTGKKTYAMKSINAALLNFYLSQFEDITKWDKIINEIKIDLDENKDELMILNGYDTIYRWITIFKFSMPLTKMIFNLMKEELNAKKFKVNDFITLKFKHNSTFIYVDREKFEQCKFLLLNIPVDKVKFLKEIKSIDEAAEELDKSLEPVGEEQDIRIPPLVEFWGHCSNLQVWYENDYDSRLLHSNLAFPLLKRLTEAGDPLAKKVFKEEILKRLEGGIRSVVLFLINEGYLDYLEEDTKRNVIEHLRLKGIKLDY